MKTTKHIANNLQRRAHTGFGRLPGLLGVVLLCCATGVPMQADPVTSGMTYQNESRSGNSAGFGGKSLDGSGTATNFIFRNNTSTGGYGGAFYVNGATYWYFENATFESNRAVGVGGAITLRSSATISGNNILFSSNTVTAAGGSATDYGGGAVGFRDGGGDLLLVSSTFIGNYSFKDGGAVAGRNTSTASGNNIRLTDVAFIENRALGNGGGLWATQGTYTLTNVYFLNNRAENSGGSDGGAIYFNTAGPSYTVNTGTFTGNYADRNGGAIFVSNGTIAATNLLFTSNTAGDRGGALFVGNNKRIDLTINNNNNFEYTGNTSVSGTGGGFINLDGGSSMLNLTVDNGSTLTIGAAVSSDRRIDSIAGSGDFDKRGQGTLILNADNSSNYTGRLYVREGAVILGNDEASISRIRVANGALVGGIGTIASGTIHSGGKVRVGLAHNDALATPSSLTVSGSLALENNSILQFDIWDNNISDLLSMETLVMDVSATSTIDLNIAKTGTYALIAVTDGFGAITEDQFKTTENGASLSSRVSANYAILANTLQLTIGKTNYAMYWTGSTDSIWSSSGTSNWSELADSDTKFINGDRVIFDDTTPGAPVAITVSAAGVVAADMVVNVANSMTFSGGVITTDTSSVGSMGAGFGAAAAGQLVKNGTGSLILLNSAGNNFTGGIIVNDGTLQGSAAALRTGAPGVTLAAATANIAFAQADTGTYAGNITGLGGLTKQGAGALTLAGVTDYAGITKVAAGSLALGAADQLVSSAAVILDLGAILNTNAHAQTLNGLAGAGNVNTGATDSLFTLVYAADATYSGTIIGAGSVVKNGAATLTLAGNQTFTGTMTVAGGTLALGDGVNAGGSIAGAIVNQSSLLVNYGAHDSTLANSLRGAGSLVKQGAGSLTLTADNTDYAGATTADGGSILLAANAKLGGAVSANSGAAVGGSGVFTNGVTIADGGSLIVGMGHNDIGTTTTSTLGILGTLSLANNATVKYDLMKDDLSGATAADLLSVNTLVRSGTTIFDINSVGTGTYTLVTSANDLSAAFASGTIITKNNGNALSTRSDDNYGLSADLKSIFLVVTTNNLELKWSGSAGTVWSGSLANWSGMDDKFVGGDRVVFDASAQPGANNIAIDSNGVQISDMIVNGATDYTFTGGVITTTTNATGLAAAAKLDKNGTGKLTLNNSGNSFLGGIEISAGTVEGNVSTLAVGAGAGIVNNGALIFNQAADATYANAITGTGALGKTGAGALTLNNAANTYAGGISVDGGSLTLLNSGTATRSAINIGAASTLAINGAAAYDVAHALTGSGTLAINLNAPASAITLNTAAIGTDYAGTLKIANGTMELATGNALANAALSLGAGNIATIGTGTHVFRSLALDHNTMIFSTTVPADKNALGMISVGDLDISKEATVKIGIPSSLPADVPATSRSLLEQDDIVDGVRLIAASGVITGNASQFILLDQNGGDIDLTRDKTIAINKSATDTTKVANATYSYKLGTNTARDGLYLGYALKTLEIVDGQTLELVSRAGSTAEGSTLSAALSGAGGVLFNAAAGNNATITLTSANTYSGETQVAGGTVKAAANNAFGNTTKLTIDAGAGVDFNGRNQTLRVLDNAGRLALGTGTLTINNSGASTGSMAGAAGGALVLANNATLNIKGANAGFHANMRLNTNASITTEDAQGLGDGRITFASSSTLTVTDGGILANSLASAANGNGKIIKSGTGTLTLTGDGSNYSGSIDVSSGEFVLNAGGRLGANAVLNFLSPTARVVYDNITSGNLGANVSGQGTLVVRNNSRMTLDRSLQNYTVELSASTLDFAHNPADDETFQTITVKNLVGSGTINFNVNFGREKTDKLVITEATDGAGSNIAIAVNPISNRRSNPDHTITLVTGADPAAQFTLVGNEIVREGVNKFKLYQGGENMNIADPSTWYLAASNQMGHAIDAIVNNAALLGADWHYELESLNKRMGEVRREIFAEGASSGGNLWLNGNAYKINGSGNLVQNDLKGYEFEQNVYGATVGADKAVRLKSGALIAGIFAGMTNMKREFDNHGDGSTDAINGGVYLTYLHQKGFYADVSLKYDSYKNNFNAHLDGGNTVSADYNSQAYGASLEIGYYIHAQSGWWCEPSVQAGYAQMQGAEYTTNSAMLVYKADSTAMQYRGMVRWGKNFGAKLNVYLKAALASTSGNDGEIIVTAPGEAPSTPVRMDVDGLRTEFGAGTNYAITKRSQLWLDYEYAKADNYTKPWSFNFGYRLLW